MLVIGLDAADRELIERWADDGTLPNIARMRSAGLWSSLDTTADVVHVSAWPSIFSGTTPDEHGLYHAYVMREGEQAPVRPRPEDCPVPFLWQLLDENNVRSIVMDAFLTCPLRDFSGVQVVDWGSWTWFSGQQILPDSIKQKIRSKFGTYPAENHSSVGMTPPPDPVGFFNRLVQGVEKKTEVVEWLMESEEWDFFLVVFGECHAAGHYFWHYQDPSYITYPEECEAELRTALKDIYIALDTAIGKICTQLGDDATVLVVSGDGMGPNYSGSHILDDLLTRMKLLNDSGGDNTEAQERKSKSLSSTLRGLVPKQLRALVSRYLLPRFINERLSLHWKTADINWSNTKAFIIENANEGFFRVNLKGREPQGVVEPGKEYDDLCEKLVDVASEMKNPETGRVAATHVHKTADLYSGPCCAQMPDVIVNWDPDALITKELATKDYGTATSEHAACHVSPYYSGNHRPNAFLAGSAAHLQNVSLQGAGVLDIAPTILTHFGISPPAHMVGTVLSELLSEGASTVDKAKRA